MPARLSRLLARGWGAVLLTLAYGWAYWTYPERPGIRPGHPEGWWGWFDQSKTLESATALAHADLTAAHHWYPLGYAILGAPFTLVSGAHAFVLIDLASLLAAYAAFYRFACNAGISRVWAAIVFPAAVLSSRQMFDQWVIPWNTTPVAALAWVLLALLTNARARPVTAGLVAASVALLRPTDAVLVASCLAGRLAFDLAGGARCWRVRDWRHMGLGAMVPVLAYLWLHLAIYGAHATDYMRHSRALGFTAYDLGWKASVILLDPRPWFGEGDGLLRRLPWLALAVAGILPALLQGRAMVILIIVLAAHMVLYLSYIDLLPTGMWRYDNVHYWTFALPGYGLLAVVLVRDLARAGIQRVVALGSIAATALLLCVHLDPVTAAPGGAAKMLTYPGVALAFDDAYYAANTLRDDGGTVETIAAMRVVATPTGVRVLTLRRDFLGAPAWLAGPPPAAALMQAAPPARWSIGTRLGFPCWLPRATCARAVP